MNKLWLRLSLSFVLVTLIALGAVAWMVRDSVEARFGQYVNVSNIARFGGSLVSDLEAYYAERGDWEGAETVFSARGGGQGMGRGAADASERGAQIFVADALGDIVAATQPDWVGESIDSIGHSRRVNLRVDGQIVGVLGEQTPGGSALDEAESRFLRETFHVLSQTAIIAGMLAFVVGVALSYSLTRPLQRLTDAIRGWQLGGTANIPAVSGTDEVQHLHRAFNDLLVRLREEEAHRRRMSADVAHELRTPVTVMRGHLEAMMDGVYPMDTTHLGTAYNQVLHLVRLVEDLRLLTLAEARRLPLSLSHFDITGTIRSAMERFAPLLEDGNIQTSLTLSDAPLTVYADQVRVQQVLDNLLSNAIRHTPSDGVLAVEAVSVAGAATVSITNAVQQPLEDDHIAHLFDRFWRGEEARQRDMGGSGLGLAITAELLRAQGGDIRAELVPDGLRLTFTLPDNG